MSDYAPTLEEELVRREAEGYYVWKPNRLFARRGDHYESADVVSDGSASEIAEIVAEEGRAKIDEINVLAEAQKALIAVNEKDYIAVFNSLMQTYQRMSNYFQYQRLFELKAVIDHAMEQLREEPVNV